MKGAVAVLRCVVGLFALAKFVQGEALAASQFWPEIDFHVPLAKNVEGTWINQGRFNSRLSRTEAALSGLEVNSALTPQWAVGMSYYRFELRNSSGAMRHGGSPVALTTWKIERGPWTFAARARLADPIEISGTPDSWFFASRIKVDRCVGPAPWRTSVFGWDETFYRSTPRGWNRNRIALGLRKEFNASCAASVYYLRQDDAPMNATDLNVVGMILELSWK